MGLLGPWQTWGAVQPVLAGYQSANSLKKLGKLPLNQGAARPWWFGSRFAALWVSPQVNGRLAAQLLEIAAQMPKEVRGEKGSRWNGSGGGIGGGICNGSPMSAPLRLTWRIFLYIAPFGRPMNATSMRIDAPSGPLANAEVQAP